MTDPNALTGVLIGVVTLFFYVLVIVGGYVWTGIAFAKLFSRLSIQPWRGWVPVLNFAEVFALGGFPRWAALAYLVPGLNIVGVVLFTISAHRVGRLFGRGTGSTVIAAVLPPLWATLLGFSRTAPDLEHGRLDQAPVPFGTSYPTGPLAGPVAGALGVPAPQSVVPQPVAPDPFSLAYLGQPPAAPVPVPVPVAPAEGVGVAPVGSWPAPVPGSGFQAGYGEPVAPAAPAPADPFAYAGSAPAPAPAPVPVASPAGDAVPESVAAEPAPAPVSAEGENPWAQPGQTSWSARPFAPAPAEVAGAGAGAPPVPHLEFAAPASAPGAEIPPAPQAAPMTAPVAPEAAPVTPAAAPVAPMLLTPPGSPTPAVAPTLAGASAPLAAPIVPVVPAQPNAGGADASYGVEFAEAPTIIPARPIAAADDLDDLLDDGHDDYEATIVVDRRPRIDWRLVLDDGTVLRLAGTSVALGRNPTAGPADDQVLPVPDSTRTLSKTHARLALADGRWTITDLGSTNGVLVDEGGEERLLDAGVAVPAEGRFVLGRVGMRIEIAGAS